MVNEVREKASLLWLLALTLALFAIGHPALIGGLLVAQAALWLGSTLPVKDLLQPLRRLAVFGLLIALSFAFLPAEGAADRWVALPGPDWLRLNLTGLELAGVMFLRVYTLVLASAWVQRSCQPGALVRGLRALFLPETVAIAVDATLAMLSDPSFPRKRESSASGEGTGPPLSRGRQAGAGTGGGMGGGRHREAEGGAQLGWADIRAGRVQAFTEVFERGMERARRWLAERYPALPAERVRDLSIVLALCLTVMGLKVLQVLPGIPFASGHKNVLIVPLFLYVAQATGMRWGGFTAGTAVGIVSFLMGYGKFGVLEVAHFALPGLLADLITPWLRATSRAARLAQYAIAGVVLGLGRFAANFLAILLAGAPEVAFLLFAPLLVSQVAFGALSCFVSVLLIKPKPADAPGPIKGNT